MADTTFINGTVIEPAWLNDVNDATYTTVPANTTAIAALSSDLSNSANALKGAGQVGIDWSLLYAQNTTGWGVRTAGQSYNILRSIPVAEWAAIFAGTSTYDVTSIINTALSTYKDVFLPAGVYSVNPDTGIQVVAGCTLRGAGKNKTIIYPVAQGGTTSELASYTKGSVIRRTFNVAPGTNSYINDVTLCDFAVVLNHPIASVTTTEIQIGIDMRNITRSIIERVHVGNIAPLSGTLSKTSPTSGYECQGYGVVYGNVSSSASSYCGGEVHTIKESSVWGAYKAIVQDDTTLSPASGAHAIRVINCDLQTAHHLLVQEQQYTTGCFWQGNVVQDCKKQNGDASSSYVLRLAGYANKVIGGYIEAGSGATYLLRFDSASIGNHVELDHWTSSAAITAWSDVGVRNYASMRGDTGTLSPGYDSLGKPVEYYDRAYLSPWTKFHWNGSAIVSDAGLGCTVTRTATGDYTITFDLPFRLNEYSLDWILDTNASSHGGTIAVISSGTSNVRVQCYAQNGGTSTAIDPRFVWVRAKQL